MLTSGVPVTPFLLETSKAQVLFPPFEGSHPAAPYRTPISIHPRALGPRLETGQVEVPSQLFHCTTQDCRDGLLTEILSLLVIKLYAGSVIAVGDAIKIQFKIYDPYPPGFIIYWERQAQTFLLAIVISNYRHQMLVFKYE